MLKRQNVSERLNNVTMYASEEYWNTVGSGIVAAGQNTMIGDFPMPDECPAIAKPAVFLIALFTLALTDDK